MMFEEYESHQHKTNKVVRGVLKKISVLTKKPYPLIITEFKNGDYDITLKFWLLVESRFNGKYNRVDFCYDCRKFTLYHEDEI